MDSAENNPAVQRRSTRIRAQIPIRITSLDPTISFNEQCHTLVVNTEGCGVRMTRPLEPGLAVCLNDLPGKASATARVANCVPLGTGGKFWLIGIALEAAGNVWHIKPAPPDWGSDVDPIEAPTPLPKKADQWPYSVFSVKGEAHPGRK